MNKLLFLSIFAFSFAVSAQAGDKLVVKQLPNQTDGIQVSTATTEKLGFHGATPVVQRSGSAQSAIGAATYAAPSAVPADITGGESPTEAEHNAVLAALASVRTQLIALAADVATHKTLVNELRAADVEKGLIKGSN